MKIEDPTKRNPEWEIDTLFGLFRVVDAVIKSMIQTHPDCERLLDQFDVRLRDAIEESTASGRTRIEEAAAAEYGQKLREMIFRRADRQIGTVE
jgi:hypothetical protein